MSEKIIKQLVPTDAWLKDHGLRARKLTREKLLKKIGFRASAGYVGSLKKNVKSRYSLDMYNIVKDNQGHSIYLTGSVDDLLKEEASLRALIHDIQERVDWLGSGSREKFGIVTERKVVVVMDSYAISNVTFGSFCSAVAELLREQIIEIDSFSVVRVSDGVSECWPGLREITRDNLRQSLAFVLSQQPTLLVNRSTLCTALGNAISTANADGVYLLVQGAPDLATHEYLQELVKDCRVPVNTCLYGEAEASFSTLLTEIAANTGGRWHRYSGQESESRDTAKLLAEISSARDVLAELAALRIELQQKNEPKLPMLPPKPADKDEKEMSSSEWLTLHGLKSCSARFYDALAAQAFKHCDKVLKVGDESKVVNAKYCQRFAHVKWWDGSIKHVIINQNFYERYKQKIEKIQSDLDKRICWVERSSKHLFGTLLEENVCILLDTSGSMQPQLPLLKKRLEKLITEQLRNRDMFTLVSFGTEVRSFSDSLVRVSPESLQAAWKWCSELQCSGSTNTLEALQLALSLSDLHGIYLLSDGSPDVPPEKILNQIKLYKDVPIHTISFNCNDQGANEFLASLAQETDARFHVVRNDDSDYVGPEPYESTDIKLLRLEIETATLDLKKMSELRAECEILEWKCIKKPPSKSPPTEKSRKRRNVKKPADLSDTESVMSAGSGATVFNSRKWLAKYGLVAQKLTIMDALAPTVITQHPKYVGVLKKKVHAKVFDEVMPFTYYSPEDKDRVSFVNPAGVDLLSYETKVQGAVALYDKKIASVIWAKLKDIERKKFSSTGEDEVPAFNENKELYRIILEKAGWPVSQKTVQLMSDEIELGELYLTQSNQLRTQISSEKKPSTDAPKERKTSVSSVKSDSYLLGYRVVAQNNVDGFYYPGTVIGSHGRTKCEVEFDDFDRQIVYVNNLIPTQGSTARPKMKAGDYVLVQLILNKRTDEEKQKLLAPGLVVKAPEQNTDLTFIILLFTGERLIASRHDLIKITKNRYKQTAQSIYKLLSRQRSSQRMRLVAEGEQDTESVASTLDEILKSNLLLNKPRSMSGGDAKLDDMINTPRISEIEEEDEAGSGTREERITREKKAREKRVTQCDVGVETQREMAKVTLECGLQVGGFDVDAQTYIGSDFWDDLEKVKYSAEDMIHPSEILVDDIPMPVLRRIEIPVLKVSATTHIQTDDILSIPDLHMLDTTLDTTQSVIAEEEGAPQSVILEDEEPEEVEARIIDQDEDTLSSSSSSSPSSHRKKLSSSSSSSSSSKSESDEDKKTVKKKKKKKKEEGVVHHPKGHVVLARWADEGWYFRGKIATPSPGGHVVRDNAGNKEDIDSKHILVDEQDGKHSLSPGDHVVALHPDYSFSYAPARISGTEDNWFFSLKFYDDTEGEVPREEMYYISAAQYHEDVEFIRNIEDSLLGNFVIVRDDTDGLYRRGMVVKCSGRTYQISLNGETILQDPSQVFTDSKLKPGRPLNPDSCCLCPLDDLQNSFAPAKITEINKDGTLKVLFYDDSELYFVNKDNVYPINHDFYVNSVNYIQSR